MCMLCYLFIYCINYNIIINIYYCILYCSLYIIIYLLYLLYIYNYTIFGTKFVQVACMLLLYMADEDSGASIVSGLSPYQSYFFTEYTVVS